jgi:hypothetical protein
MSVADVPEETQREAIAAARAAFSDLGGRGWKDIYALRPPGKTPISYGSSRDQWLARSRARTAYQRLIISYRKGLS